MFVKASQHPILTEEDIPQPRILLNGRKVVTDEQRRFMVEMYIKYGLSTWKIAKILGYLNVCVIKNLKKAGVVLRNRSDANRRLMINHDYFQYIDSYDKAYLLGLFYADGNVYRDTFTIALQEEDKYLLEQIAQEIGSNGRLGLRKPRGVSKKNAWALRVYDKQFCEHLRQHGIVERKTALLSYPTFLNNEFFFAFFHGLMDGDGHVGFHDGKFSMTLAGSPQITADIKTIIQERLDISAIRVETKRSKGTTLTLNGRFAVRFLREMYQHSNTKFCMKRKKDAFLSFIKGKSVIKITHPLQRPIVNESIQAVQLLSA